VTNQFRQVLQASSSDRIGISGTRHTVDCDRAVLAGEAGAEREEAIGKRLATLTREAGVEHYVYASVGSAHERTGIPHFDNKWRIEETVRGLRFPSHVILRPVFFMENLVAPFSLEGSTQAWVLGPDTKATDDCGGRHWRVRRARVHQCRRLEPPSRGSVRWQPDAFLCTSQRGRCVSGQHTLT
jgi:hypothetical protein